MNLAAVHAPLMHGVKAIAFRQPMLDGPAFAKPDRSDRTITPMKFGLPVATARRVADLLPRNFRRHVREKIWQVVKGTCGANGWHVGCVQTKKVHAWFVPESHISTNIELREAGEPWNGRESAGAYAAHPEGNDAHPALTVEPIERELGGDQSPDCLRSNRPVRKEQVMPSLCHDPRP